MKRLVGKVALVTGSGRGFGRSMALAYAQEGAKVVLAARTRTELEDAASVVHARGGTALVVPTDLSKAEDMYRLKDEVLKQYGRLDVLVNNAATSPWKTFDEMTIEEWDRTVAVNLRAPFILAKAFFETMKKQGRGSIINVSSKSAEIGFVAEMGYCPSKFGLEGLTQCLALELKPHNIAVNSLGVGAPPGKALKPTELTATEAERMPPEIRERYADDDSMVGTFTDAWTFLALQDASGVTGQKLSSRGLAEYLSQNGWNAAVANWTGKLTKAVYVTYDFPKSVRYQTREGGSKELKFE